MWHFSKQIFKFQSRKIFGCDMLFRNSGKFVHTSTVLKSQKKRGSFVELTNVNVRKSNEPLKVKLYPGFQESIEDIQSNQILAESTDDQLAKKIIEDFYGLDKLEYDEIGEKQKKQLALENDQFDLNFLASLLRSENVQDICCIEIPKEMNYADHMIIGTCLSVKHLNSVFETVNKIYKQAKDEAGMYTGYLKKNAGKENKWCAIDIGQFVIHLFLDEYRSYYDLESLWSCGTEFDDKYHQFFKMVSEFEQKLLVNVNEPRP